MPHSRATRPALPALTGLRFFAAMYVVVYHEIPDHWETMPRSIASFVGAGYVAVSLFFVLSGFILAYNYAPVAAGDRLDSRRFFIARLARIYPLYLFALALELPRFIQVVAEQPATIAARIGDGLAVVSASIFMVQAWMPAMAYRLNGPSWSLSAEFFFYLAFPATLWLVARPTVRRHWLLTCVALWVGSLVLVGAVGNAVLNSPKPVLFSTDDWWSALVYMPIFRIPEFIIGVVLGATFASAGAERMHRATWLARVGEAALVLLVIALASARRLPDLLLHTALLAPLFAALVSGIAAGGPVARFLSHPALVRLGEASYGMYILHVPLHAWLRGLDGVAGGRLFVSPWWVPLYLSFVVGVALYVLRYVEEPLRGYVRDWFDGRARDAPK